MNKFLVAGVVVYAATMGIALVMYNNFLKRLEENTTTK